MAIDFPASPTNGQTFTSGSVTYTYDGTKWTALASGGGAADKIEEGNTSAEVIDTGSDGRFVVTTEGSERARVDSSGRLLVGTSTARSNLYANTAAYTSKIQFETNTNTWGNGLSLLNYSGSGYGPVLALGLSFSNTQGTNTLVQAGEICGKVQFLANDGTNFLPIAEIQGYTDAATSTNDVPGRLVFSTTADGASSPTERMRIKANGTTNTYGPSDTFWVATSESSGTTHALFVGSSGASGINGGGVVVKILSNGNIQNANNSYTAFSDVKLKENVVDASSQWNDLKALQVRNYNFKEETGQQTHTQIGLIALEVELVSPGLVSESPDRDEEGNDLGTGTKSVNYSVLYMKAVKALQEAMERIETLEAKVAALEAA